MSPISRRQPNVYVEYDCLVFKEGKRVIERRRSPLLPAIKARSLYTIKFKGGKNPKIIKE